MLFQETNFGGKIWVVMKGEEIKYLTYFNKMARSIKPLDTTVHVRLYLLKRKKERERQADIHIGIEREGEKA